MTDSDCAVSDDEIGEAFSLSDHQRDQLALLDAAWIAREVLASFVRAPLSAPTPAAGATAGVTKGMVSLRETMDRSQRDYASNRDYSDYGADANDPESAIAATIDNCTQAERIMMALTALGFVVVRRAALEAVLSAPTPTAPAEQGEHF
jgi:hypothetical protein